MTERLGAIKLGEAQGEPFLGRDMGHQRNYSEDVAAIVDEETKKLLATAHQEAFDILEENRDVLDSLVLALMERETLDKAEVAEVFEPLRRRPVRPAWTGSPGPQPLEHPAGARSRRRSGPPRPRAPSPTSPRAPSCSRPRRRWRRARRPRARPDTAGPPTPGPATAVTHGGPAMAVNPIGGGQGAVDEFDHDRAAAAVRELLIAIGEDPEREGLRDTPARVARAYAELTDGPAPDAGGGAHHDLRHRARRDGARPRHRALVDVRAPPGAVHRGRPRRLHPQRERQDHRPVQAGPAGRRLRQAPAGAGAADHPGRRRAGRSCSSPAASSW